MEDIKVSVFGLYEEVSQKDKKTIDLEGSVAAGYLVTIYGDVYKSKIVSALAQKQHGFKSDEGVQRNLRNSASKYSKKEETRRRKDIEKNRMESDGDNF